jgi:hypothetical protein
MEEAEARNGLCLLEGDVHEPLEGILGNAAEEASFRPVSVRLADPDDPVAGVHLHLVEALTIGEGAIRAGTDGDARETGLSGIAAPILVPILENEAGEIPFHPRLGGGGGGGDRQSEENRGRTHKNLQFSLRFRQAVW